MSGTGEQWESSVCCLAEMAASKKEKREQAPALQTELSTGTIITSSYGGVKENLRLGALFGCEGLLKLVERF